MKKLFSLCFIIVATSCNSYNSKMNELLQIKKNIEKTILDNKEKEHNFRTITGYSEMDDSLTIGTVYSHPEMVDSIREIKLMNEIFKNELEKIVYSIDSLQKLK